MKKEIDLISYEEILGETGQIKQIPLSELYDFKNHPFQIKEDKEFSELLESIRENGVLTPCIARSRQESGYELISGHRRKKACEKLEIKTMPVIIKDLSDDEASILVVDSNIQRQKVSYKEKARAYSMKYEAMRHQGRKGGLTLDVMSDMVGESKRSIQRYISLSHLNDDLLDKIDSKKIPPLAGVELSFLKPEQQEILLEAINKSGQKVNKKQADRLRKLAENNEFTESATEEILQERIIHSNISLSSEKIKTYFGEDYDKEQVLSVIFDLLDKWKSEM